MQEWKELSNLLLEIVEIVKRDKGMGNALSNERLSSLIEKAMNYNLFREYRLGKRDVLYVAVLFGAYLDSDGGVKVRELIDMLEEKERAILSGIERVEELKKKGVVVFTEDELKGLSADDLTVEPQGVNMLKASIFLSENFVLRFNSQQHSASLAKNHSLPYKDNLEYLAEQFEWIKIYEDMKDEERGEGKQSKAYGEYKRKLESIEKRIKERLKLTDKEFPLERFKREKALTRQEALIVTALLRQELIGYGWYDIDDLVELVSNNTYERLLNRKLFTKKGRLLKEGILSFEKSRTFFGMREVVKLNRAIVKKLSGEDLKIERVAEEGLFDILTPSISLDSVVLDAETEEHISSVLELVDGKVSRLLRRWGVINHGPRKSTTRQPAHPSVTMLFYGPPGTGKTLTALALAGKLKRKILSVDCSKILSSWVGESEKNTKMIFQRYRELCENNKKPPVLLFNEADQLLSRRTSVLRAVERMYNQMQNILLEELENFEGILIATTNLLENLDPAFSRRFHYRIEFKRPGARERLILWQIHLKKIPLEEDVDLDYLAKHYELSGAQIALCVRAAAIRAARRLGKVCQDDLVTACENELSSSFEGIACRKIGF